MVHLVSDLTEAIVDGLAELVVIGIHDLIEWLRHEEEQRQC